MAMTEKLIFVMDEDMKKGLESKSFETGVSQAEIVREAVKRILMVQHADGKVEVDAEVR